MPNTRIILVNTSHPGNIGAAARAMKNMGLSELYLVSPENFPNQSAIARAAGADDILKNAVIVDQLSDALTGCELIFATSARSRSLSLPVCTPKQLAKKILEQKNDAVVPSLRGIQKKTAIIFGRESSGLTNEELMLAHYQLIIPSQENFSSLNLAAAVQVIAYEIYSACTEDKVVMPEINPLDLADAGEVNGFFDHLSSTLINIGFLDSRQPKLLMQRLRRLFNRAQLEKTEVHILRGILSTVEKKTKSP